MIKDNEVPDKLLTKLLQDLDALDYISEIAKDETASNRRLETLATLANSRTRLGKTIILCVLAKGDPRYLKLVQGGNNDLAKMLQDIRELDSHKQPLMTYKTFRSGNKRSLSVTKRMRY